MANSGSFTVNITGKSANNYLSSEAGYDDLLFSWELVDIANGTISWSLYLRSGTYGAISSSALKTLNLNINGLSYNYSKSISIGANSSRLLANGTQGIGYDSNNQRTFSVSISLGVNITWHPGQGLKEFYIGTRSGSSSFTIQNTSDKSLPPFGAFGAIVRNESPVTGECTINLTSYGVDKDGNTASIQYSGNSYVRLSQGGSIIETINYDSIPLNTNVTKLFYSLTPNTEYTISYYIKTNASDGNNVFSGSQVILTKDITSPSVPNNVQLTYNTDEPESDSVYTLSWANPNDLGYSGGTDINGTYNKLRFVINNIYCNSDSLLLPGEQSTFNWDSDSNYMSLRIEQNNDDLNFYWENESTPFYTKTNYNIPDDSNLYFSIATQRVYRDRFGTINYSPQSLNSTTVKSNTVGPIQDQAKVFVLVNGEWKQGKVFVNVNNTWKKAKRIFSKVNNQWLRQKND